MIILSCLLPAVSDDIFQHSLPMNLHKHQLHLQEQHSESFNIWSAIIRINTVGKSLIMKSSPNQNLNYTMTIHKSYSLTHTMTIHKSYSLTHTMTIHKSYSLTHTISVMTPYQQQYGTKHVQCKKHQNLLCLKHNRKIIER